MKILIIGSKGFIGTNLVSYLNKQKYEVWGADIANDNSANYIQLDHNNTDFDIALTNKFDVCVNCSGAANVPASLENPFFDYTLNTVNVFKMLDSIRRVSPHCKFINLSSAAVYGNPTSLPVSETSGLSPVSPYGCHKIQAENICKEFHENFNIQTISLRIFSAYGEGIRKQLLWDIYQKSLVSESIEFWGTGKETRDFIYILDLVEVIHVVIHNAQFDGSSINVANGEEVEVDTVIRTMLDSFEWGGSYSYMGTNRKGDPVRWVADIRKLKGLGYERKYSFEEGVNNYCNWLRK